MKVAIVESIIMPAGHEVEFDRLLIDELRRQGHEPVLMVPVGFTCKVNYDAEIVPLSGGPIVTYAGAPKWKKPWLSLLREKRRRAWFNSAAQLVVTHQCDALIIPTGTYRYVKALLDSDLRKANIPIHLILHGIGKGEMERFHKQARRLAPYPHIHLDVISLRRDMLDSHMPNVRQMWPPVFLPQQVDIKIHRGDNIRLGFFGQFRKEKNIESIIDAFLACQFPASVELIVQGATAKSEDGQLFDAIARSYGDHGNITFRHENLIGSAWDKALLGVDAIIMPYGAERYRYHWSAMLFTAIGFGKPVLVSPEINPEVLDMFAIGESIRDNSTEAISEGFQALVGHLLENRSYYDASLQVANDAFSQRVFVHRLLEE